VFRENRIEIVDGYVVLLFLGVALSCAIIALSFVGRTDGAAREVQVQGCP